MQSKFFALLYRMKYIERWSLMRNTERENIAEHSYFVSVLSHALGVIRRDVFHVPCNPEKLAVYAMFHDATEILTGDMPTPIKYFNSEIRKAYHEIEKTSREKLISYLPSEFVSEYREALNGADVQETALVKAADKLSAYIKCLEERNAGNKEFAKAEEQIRSALVDMDLPEVHYFMEHFISAFSLTLDELEI